MTCEKRIMSGAGHLNKNERMSSIPLDNHDIKMLEISRVLWKDKHQLEALSKLSRSNVSYLRSIEVAQDRHAAGVNI